MVDTLAELKKLVDVWEKQKENQLKDARICDAYIHAFKSASPYRTIAEIL